MNKNSVNFLLSRVRNTWPFFLRGNENGPGGIVCTNAELRSNLHKKLASDLDLFVKKDLSIATDSRINTRWKNRKTRKDPDREK